MTKNLTRGNVKKGLSILMSLLMAFSLVLPAFAEGTEPVAAYGTVEAFTNGIEVEGKEEILATNKEELTLSYSEADPSIFRFEDGWWAGIKVVAPVELTEEQLRNAKYRRLGADGWTEAKSFWSAKDSKEGDAEHWMGIWVLATPELIAADEDKKLTYEYEFDWSGNGFDGEVQKVSFVLDADKLNLDMTPFLGTVETFTNGIEVEGKEEITATNNGDLTLYYSKADPAAGRTADGWWAGIKVVAPAGLTEDELKEVKYRRLDKDGWTEAKSFWSAKDSKEGDAEHWMGAWLRATPEIIAEDNDGFLTINYEFDWYGNGFESAVQKISFVINTENLTLDTENYYGLAQGITEGFEAEGETDITVTNKEETVLEYSKADPAAGRTADGWWAGIKVVAPVELTEEQLRNAKYRRLGADGWTEAKSFWSAKDSKEGDAEHWMGAWMLVTPELIENDDDGKLTLTYEFDWDNNGFGISVQKVTFVVDTSKVSLNMDPFLGSVEAISEGIEVEGKEEITATNNGDLTLYYSKADPAAGRTADGWWAGIKVVAPAGLTEEELKNVKYRRFDADGWSEAKSFWNAKDSKEGDAEHWMGAWLCATPELIAEDNDGLLTINYEFDWYGNGFESAVQKVSFVIDTEKLTLDSEYNYGTISGITEGLVASGENDMTLTNEDEITLDFALADTSIGRYMDAWWIGAKISAPEGMTEAQLQDAYYRIASGDGWTAKRSFWQNKDSVQGADEHYITVWLPVTQEYVENDADGIFNWTYEFDWDGNGFGISTQKFNISIDVNKINRIHSAGCTKVIDKPAKEPECLVDGNTEASHCGVCGLTISVEEVIPAYGGHNFTEKIMDEAHLFAKADCVYYDRYYYSCSRCDVMGEDTYEDTEGSELLPHVRTAKIDDLHLVSPADCLNAAIYYEGCKNCDTVFKDTTFSVGDPKYHLFTVERVTSKAGIGKSGYISFYCKDCGTCDNSPIPLPAVTSIKLGATSYNYTGKAVTPAVTVKDAKGKTLKAGTDYTVAYANNIVPGTATAKVTLRGNYTGSYTLKYNVVVPVTSKVSFTSNTSSIRLSWNAVYGAAGYAVYVKNGNGWRLLGTTTNLSVTYSNLPQGTKYTFAVKAGIRYNGRVYWATSYKTINTATTAPATAKIVTSQNTSAIRLTWSAVKGANGYALYLKTSAGWKHLYNTANTTALFTNLKAGTNYIYAVRSITVTASNQYLLGGFREYIAATLPVAPTVNVSVSGGKATIRWNKVAGATGYQVYYKTATGSYVHIKTVGASVTSLTDTGYTAGKNYNFAVRAYKAVSGGYVFGALGGRNVTMK